MNLGLLDSFQLREGEKERKGEREGRGRSKRSEAEIIGGAREYIIYIAEMHQSLMRCEEQCRLEYKKVEMSSVK